MTLFVDTAFISHAGQELTFKIDCDALTDDDLKTVAARIATRYIFNEVHGIPRGGMRLAKALERYMTEQGSLLIVDDVLTTGTSMEAARTRLSTRRTDITGIVLFARGPCPEWVKPVFVLSEWARP